ncbi:GNAT family N-acetyltransferase [Bizionia sp. KMM 8389]
MEIKHNKQTNGGAFYIDVNGNREAEITYENVSKQVIDLNHTIVKDSLSGQGVGYKLLDAAAEFMRNEDLKAKASCSFVQHAFEKKSNIYEDVIYK